MRELEGRSYQEISELLGLTTSALETLLFRARRSLAEELENVVTCQSAELAMSRRLDKRLSRKESRRLDEHLAECASCAKLAVTQARQRRAFKGLALIPLPVGLALFKGAPAASAASLPTIGLATTNGTTGLGAATAGGGATGAGAAGAGGVAAGGSLLGAAAVKVAAAVVAGVLVTGAAYQGAKVILDKPGQPVAAKQGSAVKGAFANRSQSPSQPATGQQVTSAVRRLGAGSNRDVDVRRHGGRRHHRRRSVRVPARAIASRRRPPRARAAPPPERLREGRRRLQTSRAARETRPRRHRIRRRATGREAPLEARRHPRRHRHPRRAMAREARPVPGRRHRAARLALPASYLRPAAPRRPGSPQPSRRQRRRRRARPHPSPRRLARR